MQQSPGFLNIVQYLKDVIPPIWVQLNLFALSGFYLFIVYISFLSRVRITFARM